MRGQLSAQLRGCMAGIEFLLIGANCTWAAQGYLVVETDWELGVIRGVPFNP